MMEEIEKLMNVTASSINYRTINLGGRSFYIEGIKTVVSLGTDEIVFQLKNKILSVSGNNLKVKYLDKTSCVIQGEITSVVSK